MPPKRKAQKTAPRSQKRPPAAAAEEIDAQAMRGTFDVASIPMDEDGALPSQQRQQELRCPSASQSRRAGKGAKKGKTTPSKAKKSRREKAAEEGERVEEEGEREEDTKATDADADEASSVSLAEHTLEALVTTGSASSAADSLLQVYRRGDQATALSVILNLVAKASGVQEVELDGDALADGVDISPLLEELYARVPADAAAYLLANKDPKYRRFRRAFPEFAERLLKLSWSGDVLLDGVFLPTLAQWIISMSESKSRSFRHTATVMLLGFLQGLNVLYKDLKDRLSLARTKKDTTELQGSLEELARWRDHFFSQSVHQRLRDVAPEIRLCVFQALKGWVLEFPDEFMANKYLRYFGMPLHDKRPELRAEGLDMIWQALCTVPDAYSRMHLFLQYFTERLVEMSSDVDVRCAELAIRVVAMMVREDSQVAEGTELLKNVMIDRVLLGLFDERPTIRSAAGVLLKVFIHCRTAGEETEEEQVRAATELLCSFAGTLRMLYEERMPEKYLIDALWTPERLPLLLTEYTPMLEAAQTADSSTEVVVGVGLLTALLNKAQGRLTLGPLPKDDRKGAAAAGRKLPKGAQEAVDELSRGVSADLGAALCGILERHRGDEPVLRAAAHAVAALELGVFASAQRASHLESIMLELRRATLSVTCSEATHDALVAAWHALAFTEHPLRSAAQAHLAYLLKHVLHQVTKAQEAAVAAASPSLASQQRRGKRSAAAVAKATEEALNAWCRLSLMSSLVSTTEQWPLVQAALARQLDRANNASAFLSDRGDGTGGAAGVRREDEEEEDAAGDEATATVFELLEWMVGTAVSGALWRVSALHAAAAAAAAGAAAASVGVAPDGDVSGDGGSSLAAATTAVRESFHDVIAILLQCLRAGDDVLRSGASTTQAATVAAVVSVRSKAALHLCDVAALNYYDMPQAEQELLVDAFDSLFEYWSAQLRVTQDAVKFAVSQRSENSVLSQVAAARQQASHVEASQMRLVVGMSRLLILKRMDAALAPRVLVRWTQTSSKAVSDVFKGLFHTLRDRAGDVFHLERDILLTAYSRCAEVGATPVSVDALYQIGTKLASMHFTATTDRYYAAVVAMVHFAMEFAASTDPLFLQGSVPYCSKLHTADALRLVRQELTTQDIFLNPTNPYVRTFLTAMRKAARLEEFLFSSSAATTQAPASAGTGAGASARGSVKRSRELLNVAPESEYHNGLLTEIARSATEGGADGRGGVRGEDTDATAAAALSSSARGGGGAKAKAATRVSDTTRVVSEDGWRELPSSQSVSVDLTPQEPPHAHPQRHPQKAPTQNRLFGGEYGEKRKTGARAAVDMPTSQEMALSSLADGLNTEAFIATEEYE